jgi:hypothetical protein
LNENLVVVEIQIPLALLKVSRVIPTQDSTLLLKLFFVAVSAASGSSKLVLAGRSVLGDVGFHNIKFESGGFAFKPIGKKKQVGGWPRVGGAEEANAKAFTNISKQVNNQQTLHDAVCHMPRCMPLECPSRLELIL